MGIPQSSQSGSPDGSNAKIVQLPIQSGLPKDSDRKIASKRALVIGINYYDTEHSLESCVSDARSIAQRLIDHYGYDSNYVLCLTDAPQKIAIENSNIPTRAAILTALRWLLSDSKASDFHPNAIYRVCDSQAQQCFLGYSGHGISQAGNNERVDGIKEALVPVDFETSGVIYDYLLRSSCIAQVPKDTTLTIVTDCCYSQDDFDLSYNVIDPDSNTAEIAVLVPETVADVVLISACLDNEIDDDQVGSSGHGALSAALLAILNGNSYSCGTLLKLIKNYFNSYSVSQVPSLSFGKLRSLQDSFFL
jgi:hypothetical protein